MFSGLGSTDLILAQAQALWANEAIRPGLLFLGLAALVYFIPTGSKRDRQVSQQRVTDEQDVKRPTNTSWWRRLWWRIRPSTDLMRVDGLVIDRTGKRSHALWLGPTGAGKSESVATVRCDGARPWLAVMPDVSDPLRRRADFIWTAGKSQTPIDFLKGTPEDVAERLTTVFRSGGNGVWMMAAREAATQVIRELDQAGKPRSLQAIGAGVEELVESNRRLKTACEGWVTRFLATAMAMGPSVAAGGVDIADLLRAGKGVVIDNDRWKHPGLCGDTVAFGLAEAKRIGDLVPGGFRLIFEEADQLGERIDLADPFFAAGRRRQIAVDALLHAEEDADDAMATNSATRVYFRPNRTEQRAKVAKALDLTEREVDAIPDYHAWIEHDGKIRRLVHFPKPQKATVYRGEIVTGEQGRDSGERWRAPIPIGLSRLVLPMLPPPSAVWQKYVSGTYRENGCLRWKGKHDKAGYGYIWLEEEEKSVLIHRWRAEQAYGPIGRDPVTGKKLTVDHRRTCAKDCSDLTHLEVGVTRGENSSRRWRVRGVGIAAD